MAFEALAVADDAGRKSLADVAYESIRDRLLMLDIKPGDLLNDDLLAKSLGVGRTPVREALKRLELDRLVKTYPRRGTFATRVDVTDLSFISEIRAQLEPLAAARAARVASPAVRAGLRATLEKVEAFDVAAATVTETLQLDARVHQGIYAAAANADLVHGDRPPAGPVPPCARTPRSAPRRHRRRRGAGFRACQGPRERVRT